MKHQNEQQALSDKIKAMPPEVAAKAIDALGGFASGFLSGYEAAKAEAKTTENE